VGEHHHGGIGVDCARNPVRLDEAQFVAPAKQRDETLRHVKVGREIVGDREDDAPIRPHRQRAGQGLEQVDRSGVGGDDLPRPGADQARDLVADARGQVDPVVLGPAADEIAAPFALDDVARACDRGARQRAKRVAVEIDQAIGQRELGARRGERIGGVQALRRCTIHDRRAHRASARRTARTGAASRPASLSGSAISS